MADIIQLLPDSIANQIAAGEVIQRPASVVKELMENAIDARATEINVIIKDAGKTLVQIIDNGFGMSETDARLSFERHATSKIKVAADLFSIQTKGFRGEALASIAAISHIEMISKLHGQDMGIRILIEGSSVKKQEFCQAHDGTKISVKNLFFNVPARRKFLKTDSVELKHLGDEFLRLALAHEQIKFTLHHNEREMYHLTPGNLIQRVSGIWGKKFSSNLVPLSENTEIVKISGFIGKPEIAKRSRNNQYLFVNNRFIKNNYLNHAIKLAFENLISGDQFPVFLVFLEINPDKIDINIHPTKQEVKFEEERLIYNYLRVSVRQALGKYSITPRLDFDKDDSFDQLVNSSKKSASHADFFEGGGRKPDSGQGEWQQIFEGFQNSGSKEELEIQSERDLLEFSSNFNKDESEDNLLITDKSQDKKPFQIHGTYILSHIKSGFILIDQKSAHERVLYEKYLLALSDNEPVSQQELFPSTIELSPVNAEILLEVLPQMSRLGFIIEGFGKNAFIVKGVPVGIDTKTEVGDLIKQLIDNYSSNIEFHLGINENLARSFAVNSSVGRGKKLSEGEMQRLINELFACENPDISPMGKKCFISFNLNELNRRFIS